MEKLIRYTAPAALLVCLLLMQATLSFSQLSVHSNFKALPSTPPELDRKAVPWLPFEEDWSTGLFETNHWITEGDGNGNWRIAGQVGNSAPSAEFFYSPPLTNYQKALTSRLLNARHLIDGEIYLSFDLKHTLVNPTGQEFLKIQLLADSSWITVWADSNVNSYNWINKKLNITDPAKGNTFRFRFLAEGQNSQDIYNWMIDNISVYRECAPPLNLECYVNFPNINQIILEWDEPSGGNISAWLTWDNGINNDAIGLTGGGTFSVASRFTPAQLGQYAGTSLTTLRFFAFGEGTFVLKVWTGENAGQLVMTQAVESVVVGSWNEIQLNTPVFVSGTTEVWFGYTVTHLSDVYPAGIDAGPAVAGFGDMISLDSSIWESMATTYALNFNWNLQGFLQSSDGNRELLRYNIYDCYGGLEMIGSTTLTTFYYNVTFPFPNSSCFVVSAVYADCEAFSNECGTYIPKSDNHTEILEIYPVPADQTLNIQSDNELSYIVITNFNYQPVYQAMNLTEVSLKINTASYRNGIYLIRAIDTAGNISTGKFIVNH